MKKRLSFGKKSVLAILIIALVLTAAAVASSYRVYSDTMDSHYRRLATSVAQTAAALVDTDWLESYESRVRAIYEQDPAPVFADAEEEKAYYARYEALRDEGYEQAQTLLQKIRAANGVRSLYLAYVDEPSRTGVYLVDADGAAGDCPTGKWDVIYEQNAAVLENPAVSFPAYITDTQEYGWLCSAGVAVRNGSGEVIAHAMTDISMDEVMRDRRAFLLRICLMMALATALLVPAAIAAVRRTVVRPVNALAAAASSYVSDRKKTAGAAGSSALESLQLHTGDEVENLCRAIQQMERDIRGYIRNITAITAEKERIEAELSVAAQIQASMLPCIFPPFPERSEFSIYATMHPAKEVGGDFYDFFLVDSDHLALVIADVSGKGVPAALFMVIAKTLIKNHVQLGESPAQAFTAVNRTLCENNEAGLFVTAWLGVLTISTGELVYTNAGHNPPLIGRAGEGFSYLKMRSGLVLAGMEGVRYREASLRLGDGDALFLYTDGVTEATDTAQQLYGEQRLRAYLDERGAGTPEEVLHGLQTELGSFAKGAPQFDDVTMLMIRRT